MEVGQIVIAFFKVAVADHRSEMRSFTGVVKSVAKKTAKVDIGGKVYQVPFTRLDIVPDSADLARANID